MKSYEAARTYFSILGFIAWAVIATGGIVALISIVTVGAKGLDSGGSALASLAGILSAAAIMFTGFMGLVVVQIGRAGVDTAEYTQQMLKLSRDQLEVSRQALAAGRSAAQSFSDAQPEASTPQVSWRDQDPFSAGRSPAEAVPNVQLRSLVAKQTEVMNHKGVAIEFRDDLFWIGDTSFINRNGAERYIDKKMKR
jgi:hypothetical protein